MYIVKKWSEICNELMKLFDSSEEKINDYFSNNFLKSQWLINPYSQNNVQFRFDPKNEKYIYILELTQDYLIYIYDKSKKMQKIRKDANPHRQRRQEGKMVAKGGHFGRQKTSQHPGK